MQKKEVVGHLGGVCSVLIDLVPSCEIIRKKLVCLV